jgi:peptide/nickel transport system permease protein
VKRFILRRVGYALVSLALLSVTIFLFVRLTGDPAVLLVEPGASRGDLDAVRKQLGLDRSLWIQYVSFMSDLFRGNFGQSFYYRTPVLELYMSRLPNSLLFAAAHMRLTRSSMLEVLGSEYVKLARIKGLPEALVISKHAFKNALIPVLTLAGINLVIMVNVAVVVETVFAWPGIGRLLYEGISFRDFPVVQATVILAGAMIVVVNLVVDILYAVIDPRIRYDR